ncbi:hypothetical protein [Nostoc sp. NMS8]|uniref:hypothetical protein n=1 Tax=Nostoc sp. NMS8 TaxID=2815392 RepID=UPI0025FB17D1|nr:hypothetical protein [Nostoc sp. NMS8]MBN3959746.1 hypothetical protein [Nostoc sp. NMS8]
MMLLNMTRSHTQKFYRKYCCCALRYIFALNITFNHAILHTGSYLDSLVLWMCAIVSDGA